MVDDEPILLSIIERALRPLGYRLLIALTPEEAIKINETYEEDIDLLLTDVIMPKMNGKDLADKILLKRHGVKVVFMTGYLAENTIYKGQDEKPGIYLQKPIRINTLRQKLREVLDD
ncbi:response regulator [Desulfobacterium sp. N47]|uniref:response regulator n=1 Tax=Desulfobacterium sp. N47 TaxID=3115210 RepID=UPI003CAF9F93